MRPAAGRVNQPPCLPPADQSRTQLRPGLAGLTGLRPAQHSGRRSQLPCVIVMAAATAAAPAPIVASPWEVNPATSGP